MDFEFATATRIVFGAGALREVGALAAELGGRALVVTGRDVRRAARLLDFLAARSVGVETFAVPGEPTTDLVRAGVECARATRRDLVIGFGGGSALDAGKAIAALLTNGGDPLEYLEVIGQGRTLAQAAAPFVAIPTTAGTGSEVTKNAVLAVPEHRVKVSLRSPRMLARVALVDPELTYGLPPDVTAGSGLDALTQLLEPFVCNRPSPVTDALCREGMGRAARSLRRAWAHGDDADARADLALASLLGGLALANARLGAVHGLAGPIGGLAAAPHGPTCARLLPLVLEVNLRALRGRVPGSEALRRYEEVARILTGRTAATADDGVAWARDLCAELGIPGLARYGVTEAAFPTLIEKAAVASSMKGNPVELMRDELREILARAL